MKAFILAGGFGKRMQNAFPDTPKVMLPIAGKPLLEHLVTLCRTHGIHEIILSLHDRPEMIRGHFGGGASFGVNLTYVEEKTPRGSGGALDEARSLLNETFVMLNGDVMNQINIKKLLRFHQEKRAGGTLVIHETLHPYDSDIIEVDSKKRVTRIFRPKHGEKFVNLGNAGMFVFDPIILKYVRRSGDQSLEKDVLPAALKGGELLYGFKTNEYLKDIGTLERYQEVKEYFQ